MINANAHTLFHAIPVEATGDCIRTSPNYGGDIPERTKAALGLMADVRPPLVFASDHLTKAAAFALDKLEDNLLLNCVIPNTPYEAVILGNRDMTMPRARNGAIYSFSSHGFVPFGNVPRQFVSLSGIPFSKSQKVLDVRDVASLMRVGLQIFSLAETRQALDAQGFREKFLHTKKDPLFINMGRLVQSGMLVWENQARGINPASELYQLMGIDMSPSRPIAATTPTANIADLKS